MSSTSENQSGNPGRDSTVLGHTKTDGRIHSSTSHASPTTPGLELGLVPSATAGTPTLVSTPTLLTSEHTTQDAEHSSLASSQKLAQHTTTSFFSTETTSTDALAASTDAERVNDMPLILTIPEAIAEEVILERGGFWEKDGEYVYEAVYDRAGEEEDYGFDFGEEGEHGERRVHRWLEQQVWFGVPGSEHQSGSVRHKASTGTTLSLPSLSSSATLEEVGVAVADAEDGDARADSPVLGFDLIVTPSGGRAVVSTTTADERTVSGSPSSSRKLSRPTLRAVMSANERASGGRDKPLPPSPSSGSLPSLPSGSRRASAILVGHPEHVVQTEPIAEVDNSAASTPETTYTLPSTNSSSTPLRTPDAGAQFLPDLGFSDLTKPNDHHGLEDHLDLSEMGRRDTRFRRCEDGRETVTKQSYNQANTSRVQHSYSHSYSHPISYSASSSRAGSAQNSANHSRAASASSSLAASPARALHPLLPISSPSAQLPSYFQMYSHKKSHSTSRSSSISRSSSSKSHPRSSIAPSLNQFPAPPTSAPSATPTFMLNSPNANAKPLQLTTPTFATVSRTPSQVALGAAKRRSEAQQFQHQQTGSVASVASSIISKSNSGGSDSNGPSGRTSHMATGLPDPKELSRRTSVQALQRKKSQSQALALSKDSGPYISESDARRNEAAVELVLSPASVASSSTNSSPGASPSRVLRPGPLRQKSTSSISQNLLLTPMPASPLPPSSPPTRRQSRVPSVSHSRVSAHAPSLSVSSAKTGSTSHSRGRSRAGSMSLSSLALSMSTLGSQSSFSSLEDDLGASSRDEGAEDDMLSVRNAVYIDSEEVRERLDQLLAMGSENGLDFESEVDEDPVEDEQVANYPANSICQTSYGSSSQVYIGPGSTSSIQSHTSSSWTNSGSAHIVNVCQDGAQDVSVSSANATAPGFVELSSSTRPHSQTHARSSSTCTSQNASEESSTSSSSAMSSVLGSYFNSNSNSQQSSTIGILDNTALYLTNNPDMNVASVSASAAGTSDAVFTGYVPGLGAAAAASSSHILPTPLSQQPLYSVTDHPQSDQITHDSWTGASISTNINYASGPGTKMNLPAAGEFFFDGPLSSSSLCSSMNMTNPTIPTSAMSYVEVVPSSSVQSLPPSPTKHVKNASQPPTHQPTSSQSSFDSLQQKSTALPTRPPPAPPLDMQGVAVAMDVALSPVMSASGALLSPVVGTAIGLPSTGTGAGAGASDVGLASPLTVREELRDGLNAESSSMAQLEVEDTMTFARTELSDSDDDILRRSRPMRARAVSGMGGRSRVGSASHGASGRNATSAGVDGVEVSVPPNEEGDYSSDDDGRASFLRGLGLEDRIAFPEHDYVPNGPGVNGLGLIVDNASTLDRGSALRTSMDSFALDGIIRAVEDRPDIIEYSCYSKPPMERSMSRWSLGSSVDGAGEDAKGSSSRNSKDSKKDKKEKKRNSRKSLVPSDDSGSRDFGVSPLTPQPPHSGNLYGSLNGKEGKKRGRLASFMSRLSSVSGGTQAPPNSSSSSRFQFEDGELIPPVPSTPSILSSGMNSGFNSATASGAHTPIHTSSTPADVLPPHTVVRGVWEATSNVNNDSLYPSPPPSATSATFTHRAQVNAVVSKPSLSAISTNKAKPNMSSKSVPSSPVVQLRPSFSKGYIPPYPPPPPPTASHGGLKSPSVTNLKAPFVLTKSSAPSLAFNGKDNSKSKGKGGKGKPLAALKAASEGLVGFGASMMSTTFLSQMQPPPTLGATIGGYGGIPRTVVGAGEGVGGGGLKVQQQPMIRGRSSSAADLLSIGSGSRASREQQHQYRAQDMQRVVSKNSNLDTRAYVNGPTSPTTPTRPATPVSRPSLMKSKSTSVFRPSRDYSRQPSEERDQGLAYLDRSTDGGHSGEGRVEQGYRDEGDEGYVEGEEEEEEEEDYGVVMNGKGSMHEKLKLQMPDVGQWSTSSAFEVDDAPPVPPKEPAQSMLSPLQETQQPAQRQRLMSMTSFKNLTLSLTTSSSNSNGSATSPDPNSTFETVIPPVPSIPTAFVPTSPIGNANKPKGFKGFVQRIGLGGKSNGVGNSGPSTPVMATFTPSEFSNGVDSNEKESRSSSGSSSGSPPALTNAASRNVSTDILTSPTLSRSQSRNMLLTKLSMPRLADASPYSPEHLPSPPSLNRLNSSGSLTPISADSPARSSPFNNY
ncbi:hypothetical protein CPC08DRAFT_726268 [Agrocybe pediades]|nr:hypothetical protein CPC08DRAFT_726268 [Agrocybe pediades]